MYHTACKVEFQPFIRSYSQLKFFNFFIKYLFWTELKAFSAFFFLTRKLKKKKLKPVVSKKKHEKKSTLFRVNILHQNKLYEDGMDYRNNSPRLKFKYLV